MLCWYAAMLRAVLWRLVAIPRCAYVAMISDECWKLVSDLHTNKIFVYHVLLRSGIVYRKGELVWR